MKKVISFLPQPDNGLLVLSSYNHYAKVGCYCIYDIWMNEYVVERAFFNISASDNVIAFLGIGAAIRHGIKNEMKFNIYSANTSAISWALKKCCRSTVADVQMRNEIEEVKSILSDSDMIHFWQRSWGTPKGYTQSRLSGGFL